MLKLNEAYRQVKPM